MLFGTFAALDARGAQVPDPAVQVTRHGVLDEFPPEAIAAFESLLPQPLDVLVRQERMSVKLRPRVGFIPER